MFEDEHPCTLEQVIMVDKRKKVKGKTTLYLSDARLLLQTKKQQNSNLNFYFVTKEHLFQTCLPSQKRFKNVSNLRNETALYSRTNCNNEKKKKIEGQKHALFV